jgi:hypothetical protein
VGCYSRTQAFAAGTFHSFSEEELGAEGKMDSLGNLLGRLIAEVVVLVEGTLAHYVDISTDGGNITNISLSSAGQSLCQNWANLLVSFAGAMNAMMTALWSTHVS